MNIPVSVIVVTKNEDVQIVRCLTALAVFDEVVVVDSHSTDRTKEYAQAVDVRVVDFEWNGLYPKKRQWCLNHLDLAHDWVFFVDADEVVPRELAEEIAALDFTAAGYFVGGVYVAHNKTLKYGVRNNKLCLFDRRRVAFPVVDDLDLPGMGEIEGHYQPVLKPGCDNDTIGCLRTPLLHYALDDPARWQARHERYAAWEAAMIARKAYPCDPVPVREALKCLFRRLPGRGALAFIHSYLVKGGILDGWAGLALARSRHDYYRKVEEARRALRLTASASKGLVAGS